MIAKSVCRVLRSGTHQEHHDESKQRARRATDIVGRSAAEHGRWTWRAADYLSVGQIDLLDNPLLRKPSHPRGHETAATGALAYGLNFVYAHLNRIVKRDYLYMIFVTGLGMRTGGGGEHVPGSTYSELYPDILKTEPGTKSCSISFPFPGGIPTTGGGDPVPSMKAVKLGVASHSFGAAFLEPGNSHCRLRGWATAKPRQVRSRRAGTRTDPEPATDGADRRYRTRWLQDRGPTVPSRISCGELKRWTEATVIALISSEGDEPMVMIRRMGCDARRGAGRGEAIQKDVRRNGSWMSLWPMITSVTLKAGPAENG